MSLHGVSSGELNIKSSPDNFFNSFTKDIHSPFDKLQSVDKKKRKVTVGMSGCLISQSYKSVKVTITVNAKGKGSHVAWTVEFEKIRRDIEEPRFISDTLVNYLKETDHNLRA
ncbi:unnamed protein product [Cochlearia groenlandica]